MKHTCVFLQDAYFLLTNTKNNALMCKGHFLFFMFKENVFDVIPDYGRGTWYTPPDGA